MRYITVSENDKEIVVKTEKGEKITLKFASEENFEAEDRITENLMLVYESRIGNNLTKT